MHNIGDVGHTPGLLRYLTEFLPEAQVSCWLAKTNDQVSGMLTKRFPGVEFLQGDLDNAGVSKTSPGLQSAFEACDCFVIGSGMLFNRFWGPPLSLLLAAKAKGRAFGMWGESFDGFRDAEREVLPRFYSKASFMFCRDGESLKFLKGIEPAITPGALEFGPDGCFGIDVRDEAKAEKWLAEQGLEAGKFVCVIFRSDAAELGSDPKAAETKEKAAARLKGWVARFQDMVTWLVKETGMKVALVPEVEKEIWAEKKLIYEGLPEEVKVRVVVRDTWWCCDEACSVYARASALVAGEPHSLIMALANGVPGVHWFSAAHGTKAWMFRDIGLPEWLIDLDLEPVERVKLEVGRMLSDPGMARAKVKRAMGFVHARSSEMARAVASAAPWWG